MNAVRIRLTRMFKEQVIEFVEDPRKALRNTFILSALVAPILPDKFYSDSLSAVFGAGFTMLGFGLTASSVLTSLVANEYVMRLKATNNWKQLTGSFSRSNSIFWALTLYTLVMFGGFLGCDENKKPCSALFLMPPRIIYLGLIGMSFAAAGTIVFLLHKVLNFPLTDRERRVIEQQTNPTFPPPAGGTAVGTSEGEAVEVNVINN